tara:strand:+ start:4811 stop:5947 length:1137 start_codon:yes stop_codon:yes gene_type:complete
MQSIIRVNNLRLLNYRNHKNLKLHSNRNVILLYGENGSGKTNILEAISIFFSSNGFRNAKILSLIPKEFKNISNFGININLLDGKNNFNIGLGLRENKESLKKIIRVDGQDVVNKSFYEKYKIFWLIPSMNNLFISSSTDRRDFLDLMIKAYDLNHGKNLMVYKKLQRERLQILKKFYNVETKNEWLDSIEKKMASVGIIISDTRRNFVKKMNEYSLNINQKLPMINLELTGEIDIAMNKNPALYVEESFLEKLKKNRDIDNLTGRTKLSANRLDLRVYNRSNEQFVDNCSTGEQKVIIICIVFLFIQVLKEKAPLKIIFLLDDIFAFLDKNYINLILDELVELNIQTWITNVNSDCIDKTWKSFKDIMFLNINDIKM